jgi:hypothetical protein
LRIKKFRGFCENALKRQIRIATLRCALTAKERLKLGPSLYGLIWALSLAIFPTFETTTLLEALWDATTRENNKPRANHLNLLEY